MAFPLARILYRGIYSFPRHFFALLMYFLFLLQVFTPPRDAMRYPSSPCLR